MRQNNDNENRLQFDLYTLSGVETKDRFESISDAFSLETLNSSIRRFSREWDLTDEIGDWFEFKEWVDRSSKDVVIYLSEDADIHTSLLAFGADGTVTQGVSTGAMTVDEATEIWVSQIRKFRADFGFVADICEPPTGETEFKNCMDGLHFATFTRDIFN